MTNWSTSQFQRKPRLKTLGLSVKSYQQKGRKLIKQIQNFFYSFSPLHIRTRHCSLFIIIIIIVDNQLTKKLAKKRTGER